MHARLALLVVVVVGTACRIHRVSKVEDPSQVGAALRSSKDVTLRLVSPSGSRTEWLSRSHLVVVGDRVCVRNDAAWSAVTAIRVTKLTDANIAAILVDLPRTIRVTHLGNGAIELATAGRKPTAWMRSRAHDPADRGIPRYSLQLNGTWSEPLTWSELASGAALMDGWPLAGATAEVRDVDVVSTVAVSIVAAPLLVGIAFVDLAPRASVFPGEGGPPAPRSGETIDGLTRVVEASAAGASGTWARRACLERLP